MVKLGDKVTDTVSGFTGVAIAAHEYLNGCRRISIQPPVDGEGKLPDSQTFDELQLKILESGVAEQGSQKTGGPEKYMPKDRTTG